MAEMKPIGSEKLGNDEKIKRILELTYYNNQNNTTQSSKKAEFISETVNGTYGIVKEKDGYYVKKGLNEDTLDYIGGLFMKNKNRFSSYAEAFKRLDLLKGQEELQEETKYVLKINKPSPQTEAPTQQPSPAPSSPAPSSPTDDSSVPPVGDSSDIGGLGGDTPEPPIGDDTGVSPDGQGIGEDEHLKVIQKLTGKLGQKLREYSDKLESDDIKYVLNSIISAIDINKLDDGAKEEILSKFDPDENGLGDDTDTSGMSSPKPSGLGGGENEMGEESSMDALENLINTPLENNEEDEYEDMFKFDVDEEDYNQETKDGMSGEKDDNLHDPDFYESGDEDLDEETPTHVKEVSLEELTDMINQTVKERLGKYFE